MADLLNRSTNNDNWKSQVYITGAAVGTLFGLLAAYLYARSASDDMERHGTHARRVSSTELLTLALAAIGVMRQVAELGRAEKGSKK
jgi:hypothetical protein